MHAVHDHQDFSPGHRYPFPRSGAPSPRGDVRVTVPICALLHPALDVQPRAASPHDEGSSSDVGPVRSLEIRNISSPADANGTCCSRRTRRGNDAFSADRPWGDDRGGHLRGASRRATGRLQGAAELPESRMRRVSALPAQEQGREAGSLLLMDSRPRMPPARNFVRFSDASTMTRASATRTG